jgi:hypothetical protein
MIMTVLKKTVKAGYPRFPDLEEDQAGSLQNP